MASSDSDACWSSEDMPGADTLSRDALRWTAFHWNIRVSSTLEFGYLVGPSALVTVEKYTMNPGEAPEIRYNPRSEPGMFRTMLQYAIARTDDMTSRGWEVVESPIVMDYTENGMHHLLTSLTAYRARGIRTLNDALLSEDEAIVALLMDAVYHLREQRKIS